MKIDVRDVIKKLEKMDAYLAGTNKNFSLLNTAQEVVQISILMRTGRGVDMNEVKFKPYTASYARKRRALGKQTEVVDLEVTGTLKESFGPRPDGSLDFAPDKEAKIAEGLMRDRKFFGANPKDEEAITKRVERELQKIWDN